MVVESYLLHALAPCMLALLLVGWGQVRQVEGQFPANLGWFVADPLNVVEEIPPPVAQSGTGNATFFCVGVPGDWRALQYSVFVSGLGSITEAHIHEGVKGTNGPIVVDLYGPIANPSPAILNGFLGQGFITQANLSNPNNEKNLTSFNDLFNILSNGSAYVNVHTKQNPMGVIRAQIYPAPLPLPEIFLLADDPLAFVASELVALSGRK